MLARAKIDRRMSLIVASRSSTAWSSRETTSGRSTSREVPCSPSPTANNRWMTRSCRSRPIRSRSSKHRQALLVLAGPGDLQRQGGLLGEAGRQRRVQGVVLLGPLPAPRQGQGAVHLLAGAQRHHHRGSEARPTEGCDRSMARGSVAMSSTATGDPVRPRRPPGSAPTEAPAWPPGPPRPPTSRGASAKTASWPVRTQATSAPATSRARSAIVCRASTPERPAVRSAVISAVAASQCCRREASS